MDDHATTPLYRAYCDANRRRSILAKLSTFSTSELNDLLTQVLFHQGPSLDSFLDGFPLNHISMLVEAGLNRTERWLSSQTGSSLLTDDEVTALIDEAYDLGDTATSLWAESLDKAEANAERASALCKQALESQPEDIEIHRSLAVHLAQESEFLLMRSRLGAAALRAGEAHYFFRRRIQESPYEAIALFDFAMSTERWARVLDRANCHQEALGRLQESNRVWRDLHAIQTHDPEPLFNVARTLADIGRGALNLEEYEVAKAAFIEADPLFVSLSETSRYDARAQAAHVSCLINLCHQDPELIDVESRLKALDRALPLAQALAKHSADRFDIETVAVIHDRASEIHLKNGDGEESLKRLKDAFDLYREVEILRENPYLDHWAAGFLEERADIALELEELNYSLHLMTICIQHYEQHFQQHSAMEDDMLDLWGAYTRTGYLHYQLDNPAESRRNYERSLDWIGRCISTHGDKPGHLHTLADTLESLGDIDFWTDQPEQGRLRYAGALAAVESAYAQSPNDLDCIREVIRYRLALAGESTGAEREALIHAAGQFLVHLEPSSNEVDASLLAGYEHFTKA